MWRSYVKAGFGINTDIHQVLLLSFMSGTWSSTGGDKSSLVNLIQLTSIGYIVTRWQLFTAHKNPKACTLDRRKTLVFSHMWI